MADMNIHLKNDPVTGAYADVPVDGDDTDASWLSVSFGDGFRFNIFGRRDQLETFAVIADLLAGRKVVTPMPMDEAGTSGAVLLSEVG